MKYPSIQFYPGDWRKDPGVQSLTFEERGIWFELLLIMSDCEPRGKLMLGGKPIDEDRLAQMLHLDKQKITTTITTLITIGVARLCPKTGSVMSKRMVEDTELLEKRRACGAMGGNPNFKKGKKNPYYEHVNEDNQIHNQEDNQKITPSSSSSSSDELNKIEPPSGFPKSEQEAIDRGETAGASRETCVVAYNLAVSRNYTDDKGRPIGSWAHYVKAGATMNASRQAERASLHKANGNVPRGTYQKSGTDKMIERAEREIDAIARDMKKNPI